MWSGLRTVLHWMRIVDPLVLVGYCLFTLVRRRREESVRQFTHATALGVGLAIAIAVALFALTLFI